jgi:hypothetical protein
MAGSERLRLRRSRSLGWGDLSHGADSRRPPSIRLTARILPYLSFGLATSRVARWEGGDDRRSWAPAKHQSGRKSFRDSPPHSLLSPSRIGGDTVLEGRWSRPDGGSVSVWP